MLLAPSVREVTRHDAVTVTAHSSFRGSKSAGPHFNELQTMIKEVAEAAGENLVIGQA